MSKRILVIDNDDAIRELFNAFLTDDGWDVFSGNYTYLNITSVLQLLPDLIILDLNMVQSGSGWGFLQLLRMEQMTAAIPVLVCTTATSLAIDLEGYLASQHISIVRKPFDIETMLLTIHKILIADLVLPILIVEDDDEIASAISIMLEIEGYIVMVAGNGQLALNAVKQAHFGLILLDISLPVMTGLEFLAIYAQSPEDHSPVIILSAQSDLTTEQLPSFVVNVLLKPFEINYLLILIKEYMNQPN